MKTRHALATLAILALGAATALAQQGRVPTTVQLPTYSYFGVNTSVLVPDRGSVSLGGVGRSAQGRVESGMPLLPGSRAIGGAASAGGASVSVFIHDFEAMDRALLSVPTRYGAELARRKAQAATTAGVEEALSHRGVAVKSVAELQAEREQLLAERSDEAQRFWLRAQAAEAEGKAGVAKIYYQMVVRRDRGALQEQAIVRLEALAGGAADRVARTSP